MSPIEPRPVQRWIPGANIRSVRRRDGLTAALFAVSVVAATTWLAPTAQAESPSPVPVPSASVSAQAGGDPGLTATAAGSISTQDAERQAQLVQGEDERLIDVRIAGKTRLVTYPLHPYRVRSTGFYTLVLPARRAAYTFDDLRQLAPQTFLPQPDGSFLLREHILVDTGATLALAPERPTTIRLLSNSTGFVSIISRGGRLRLLGSVSAPLTFTSWDETANRPDTTVTDGRAYILAMGQLIVRHSHFEALGFWSGRTGGLALEGSGAPTAGKDLTKNTVPVVAGNISSTGRQITVLPAGAVPTTTSDDAVAAEIGDTEVDGDAFGLFVTGSSGLKVHNVVIRSSLVHGLVLHRSVKSATVDQLRVERSAVDGIVITRGVEGTTLSQVTSSSNGLDGVVITGTPLATGPSPSGGSVRQFGNNVLTASMVEDNARVGIRVNGGTNVRVMGNSIKGGHQGILVADGADGVVVEANRVVDADANGIQVRQARGVEITGNSVRNAPTGLHISDAVVEAGDNTVTGATLHAISITGNVVGSTIRGNTLAGSGSAAIDVSRITLGKVPDIRVNDTGGWHRVITKDGALSTLMHPLTLIWLVIASLVLGSKPLALRRRKQQRAPYLEVPARSQSTADIDRNQVSAIGSLLAAENATGADVTTDSQHRLEVS